MRRRDMIRKLATSVVATLAVAALGADCTTPSTIQITTGSRTFGGTSGVDGTYAWDRELLLPSLGFPYEASTSSLVHSGEFPRELVVIDQSHPELGVPPIMIPIHYATVEPGSSASTPWAVDAARVIDHGACQIILGAAQGSMDSQGVVTGVASGPDTVNTGFLPGLSNSIDQALHDAGSVRRLEAKFQLQWSQIDTGGVASSNSDGFSMYLKYLGCSTVTYIPPGIPIVVCKEMRTTAGYSLAVVDGYVKAFPINVYVAGDWPADQAATLSTKLRTELPESLKNSFRSRLSVPSIAVCDPGDDTCCKASVPFGGSTIAKGFSGIAPLLVARIQVIDGVSPADAEARAAAILKALSPTRLFADPDSGMCRYALRVRRVNVMPGSLEFVLANASEGVSDDAKLVQYLSPADVSCSSMRMPIPEALVPTYFAPEAPN